VVLSGLGLESGVLLLLLLMIQFEVGFSQSIPTDCSLGYFIWLF